MNLAKRVPAILICRGLWMMLGCMALTPSGGLLAEIPADYDENGKLEKAVENGFLLFKWQSKPGRIYFIQYSEDLLRRWQYAPVIELGDGSVKEWKVAPAGTRLTVRLRHHASIAADPAVADSDTDGLPNEWEIEHGLDPLSDDSRTDADSDGLDALAEFWIGTDPSGLDSDSDVSSDGREIAHGTNPLGSDGGGLSAPSEIAAKTDSQGACIITWTNKDERAKHNILQRSEDGVNWTTVAVLPAGVSTFTDATAPVGVALLYALIASDR